MPNSLQAVVRQLLAQGLLALRQQAIMPRLVNVGYSDMAGERGSSIDVPIPSAVTVRDVTPGTTPQANQDATPSKVTIPLDQWKEASFYLTDKEQLEVQPGHFPSQASEAIKALANTSDTYLMNLYKLVYNVAGAAGTTPFASSIAEYSDARKQLNISLAPFTDRRVVLDPSAEANALTKISAFFQADQRGDQGGVVEGFIGRKVGADWYLDQNVVTHTSTPLSAGAATVNGVHAVGFGSTDNGRTGTVSIAKATNPSNLVKGDIITFTGDTQTYAVTADVTLAVGNTTVGITPALRTAKSGGETVTLKATHVVNLLFHRDAFAFANRPLSSSSPGLGNIIESAVDPVTGLTLRLEVSRQFRQTTFGYDMLYGGVLVRPELACRIMG